MKIVLTIHHALDADSGAPGATLRLADAYRRAGHGVVVLSHDDLPAARGTRVTPSLFAAYLAGRLMRGDLWAADVVDASTADAWMWAVAAARRPARPLLVTRSHGLEHVMHEAALAEAAAGGRELSWRYGIYHGGARLREVRSSIRRADMVFVLNERDRRFVVDHGWAGERTSRVVRNGVGEAFIGRPAPLPVSGPVRLAHVGSFMPRKGIAYSVPAFARILDDHPETSVGFFGTGRPEEEVLSAFPEHLRSRVRVVPRFRQHELPELLRDHHISVLASLSEGSPLSVLECMACGLAPVVSQAPGLTQEVTDGVEGLVVPERDADAIQGAVETLLADPAMLGRMRAAAYERAQGLSWDRVARDQLRLYEEALRDRGRGPAAAS